MTSRSNVVKDDEEYWNKTQLGFNFKDDEEQESNPLVSPNALAAAKELNKQLREEVVSVSGFSLGSTTSDDSSLGPSLETIPQFLLVDPTAEYVPSTGLAYPRLPEIKESIISTSGSTAEVIKLTIEAFLLGHEVHLECFKSLSDKRNLLIRAIESNDGNAILGVTIFLHQTLRPSIFQQILMEFKIAANHYLRYLETRSDTALLVDTLSMLGRTTEALYIRYKTILRSERNLDKIESQLKHFYSAECNISDEFISNIVKSHIDLIVLQKKLVASKSFVPANHLSILGTLGFLIQYFYDDTSSEFAPRTFQKQQKLNEKQFSWIALNQLLSLEKWPKIETLLISKSWLGTSRNKCLLPLEDVCNLLYQKKAPESLISLFLPLVDNAKTRLTMARKYGCHMIVLDTLASIKDRNAITEYKTKLKEHSKEFIHADHLLNQNRIQWKN